MEDNKLEVNIAAKRAAIDIFSLAVEEGEKHGPRFWDKLRRLVKMAPSEKVQQKRKTPDNKMTDEESRSFDNERVPFRGFEDWRVADVPKDVLQWYADQTFVDDLRRYLNSDRIRRE